MLQGAGDQVRRAGRRKALGASLLALAGLAFVAALYTSVRQPVADGVLYGEQFVVESEKPLVCVHTLLENEVEEAKIVRSLALARELGAGTIVQFFPWAYYETRQDDFAWERADMIIRQARRQGLEVIARLGLAPAWARGTEAVTTLNTLPELSYHHFADYAAAFAGRYAGEVDHIIIWNEPNLSFEWGYQPVAAAGYVSLLRETYSKVKRANPAAVVLAGALAPTLEQAGSGAGLNDLDYLRAMYAAGAADYFDALAVHSYGFLDPPEARPAPKRLNFRRAELLREIMVEHGDGGKRVFITESGWNDHPRWTGAVRPSQRSAYTVRAFEFAEAEWGWLERLCIWALRYPANLNAYPDYATLISPEFVRKPVYLALQDYARGWKREGTPWLPPPSAS